MTGVEAARDLLAALTDETAALARGAYDEVAALSARKREAADIFGQSELDGASRAAWLPLLRAAAEENQAALARAIRLQGRVLDMLARAARRAVAADTYGAQGGRRLGAALMRARV